MGFGECRAFSATSFSLAAPRSPRWHAVGCPRLCATVAPRTRWAGTPRTGTSSVRPVDRNLTPFPGHPISAQCDVFRPTREYLAVPPVSSAMPPPMPPPRSAPWTGRHHQPLSVWSSGPALDAVAWAGNPGFSGGRAPRRSLVRSGGRRFRLILSRSTRGLGRRPGVSAPGWRPLINTGRPRSLVGCELTGRSPRNPQPVPERSTA